MNLSIITINYNNCEGLKKTIASVMSQTWRDFEWIIIDGGSTDGSKEVIEEVAANPDSNITYWCSEPDKGIYNAMNKGITHASGEYLNFMNSGDCYYESTTLDKVFEQNHTADIVYGDWKRIWSDHEDIKSFPYPIEIYSFFKENISHQAMFINCQYHLKHLYDETYHIIADYKNWVLAALNGASFSHISIIVCVVTMDGLSNQRGDLNKREGEKLQEELWTPPLRITLQKLDYLLHEPYQMRIRTLLSMGGFPKLLTLVFLKIMKKLYLRNMDEEWR